MSRIRTYRVAFAAFLIAAAACGDRDDTPQPATAQDTAAPASEPPAIDEPAVRGIPADADSTTVVARTSEWAIALSTDTIDAGPVTIAVDNGGTIPHAVELTGEFGGRWRSLPVAPGATIRMSMVLSNGTYQLHCPLDDDAGDHSERGERATLVVR